MASFGTEESWSEWRDERDASFKDPYGWFSLVELTWLGTTPQELENFPGLWSASEDGQTITVEVPDDQPIYRDGEEVHGTVTIDVAPGVTDRSLKDSRGREVEAMYRFGKPGVRIRDPHAPALAGDYRVARYKFNPKWVVRGRMLRYPEIKDLTVDAAVPGGSHTLHAWGDAEVALPKDRTATLIVTGEAPDDSSVIFYDETNGDTTAGWRRAPLVVDGETVVIDFNRATIFPAHMSPYGTCPKPPADNRIKARVKAGEKMVVRP